MEMLICKLLVLAIWASHGYARTTNRDLRDNYFSRQLTRSQSLFGEFLYKRACVADGGRCGPGGGEPYGCCGNNCFGGSSNGGVCGNPQLDGPLRGHASETYFNDFDVIGSSGLSFPERINVRKWGWVDSIEVNYKTSSGMTRSGSRRGGTGGVDCVFTLDPDERIVKVEGAFYNHMDYLQFTTNKGRRSERCGGSRNDNYFSEQHPGYVLSYISGYYGWYLNGIKFHWVREEVQYLLSSIRYDVSHLTNQNLGQPRTVYATTLINRSPTPQKQSYAYTFQTEESSSWSLTAGYTLGVSTTVTAGVPEVASVGVTVSHQLSVSFQYGRTSTVTQAHTQTIEVEVPANSKMSASIVVLEGRVEVPYECSVTVVFADGSRVSRPAEKGVFQGIQAISTHTEYGTATPL